MSLETRGEKQRKWPKTGSSVRYPSTENGLGWHGGVEGLMEESLEDRGRWEVAWRTGSTVILQNYGSCEAVS